MYTGRRRKYYSKKYYRNRLFAPSLKKANMPNYYQMKGRIIQQSPARIKETPTQMMNRDILDKYYKTLIEYKYPLNQIIPVDPDAYFYHINKLVTNFHSITESIDFDSDYIYNNFVQTIESQLPPHPDNYHYIFNVTSLTFHRTGYGGNDNSRFNFNWDSSLLSGQQLAIITKSNDSNVASTIDMPIIAVSNGVANQLRCSRVGFAASVINLTFSVQNTTDAVTTDNGFYPFITNDSDSPFYGSKITFSSTTYQSTLLSYIQLEFGIDIMLKADE